MQWACETAKSPKQCRHRSGPTEQGRTDNGKGELPGHNDPLQQTFERKKGHPHQRSARTLNQMQDGAGEQQPSQNEHTAKNPHNGYPCDDAEPENKNGQNRQTPNPVARKNNR
jgi:hypothetical protein